MDYDVIIIGGGASGMMLAAGLDLRAIRPRDTGDRARGVILEKTEQYGTKVLMSGGGRCNITHGGSIKDFPAAYGEAGPRLRKCLYRHSNLELAGWLEDSGLGLADEKGRPLTTDILSDAGRVFPESMKSADVLSALIAQAKSNGWELRTGAEVCSLTPAAEKYDAAHVTKTFGAAAEAQVLDNAKTEEIRETAAAPETDGDSLAGDALPMWTVETYGAGTFTAPYVVIATGGITFPETGSDGSVLEIVKRLGAEVTEPRSALAPVHVRDYPYEELSGISIDDVTVTAFGSDAAATCKGKAARMTGSLLFTHTGFSGPVILNISRYAEPGQLLRINYNKSLDDLPRRMKRILEDRSRGPSGDIRTTVLASLLDQDDFTVGSVDECGMVTAGGISLGSIDMKTMQLADRPGLFAIGEAIDADGITGGYNLQMCWSTARTAADAILASAQ